MPEVAATPTGAALLATWLTFGIVSVASKALAWPFPKLGLPLITGYLFIGALAGPFVLGLIHKQDLQPLSLVTQFALAFISFSAGAELYLPELRALFKRILYATSGIAVVTFVMCTAVITAFASGGGIIPFMETLPMGCRVSVASIAAAIMVARSPASAIAVVKELRAKGKFTSSILGITVAGDVVVLLAFTLTTTIAESECKGEGFSIIALAITVAVIVASIIIGYALGHFLLVLMLFKRLPTRYLILPLGLAVFVFCHWFTDYTQDNLPYVVNLEPLLICIMAGYVCSNKSKHRHRFIGVLQQAGPYVFLPFFTLTGASLDLRVMVQSFGFAALTALLRAACIFVGSSTGNWLAGEKPYTAPVNMLSWMCLLTQAGVSLGLASEVGMSFPEWGRSFQTAIIAVVLVNQIVGPILFKIAVRRMGEAGKASSEDAHDADAVVPTALIVGYSPSSLALATRLLGDRWKVTMVCANDKEAAAAQDDIVQYATLARKAKHQSRGATDKVVDGLKAGAKALAEKGKVMAEKAVDAAVSVAATATGAPAAATAKKEEHPEEEEHDHEPKRNLEDGFSALGLLGSDTPASDNPLSILYVGDVNTAKADATAAAAGTEAGAGDAVAGTDHRFLKLVQLLSETRSLAAIGLCCPSDAANYAAAQVVEGVIAAAPKRSSLHSVRVLAVLHFLPWSTAFEALGVLPVHAQLHATHLAAKLLSAPRGRPLTVLPATANQDDLCKAVAGLLQGPHFWKFGDDSAPAPAGVSIVASGSPAGGRPSSPPPPPPTIERTASSRPARTVSGRMAASLPSPGRNESIAAATMSMQLSSVSEAVGAKLVESLQAEDVGEWAGAREEYLDSLHAMGEDNGQHGEEQHEFSTPWDEPGSARQKKSQIEDVAMFGSLNDLDEETAEETEGAGKTRGLAAEDSIF